MKYILYILFTISVAFGQFAGGTGTWNDPYLIATAVQLDSMRHHPSLHFKLTADINMNDLPMTAYGNWIPIPQKITNGWWALDGNGHTIRNMTIKNLPEPSSGDKYYGLFGYLFLDEQYTGGVVTKYPGVKNLRIVNATIKDSATTDPRTIRMGVLAGSILISNAEPRYTLDNIIIDSCNVKFYRNVDVYNAHYVGGISGSISLIQTRRVALTNSRVESYIYRQRATASNSGTMFGQVANGTAYTYLGVIYYGFQEVYGYNNTLVIGGAILGGNHRHGGFAGTDNATSGSLFNTYMNNCYYYNNTTTQASIYAYMSTGANTNCGDTLLTVIKKSYFNIKYIPYNADYNNVAFTHSNYYRKYRSSTFFNYDSSGTRKEWYDRANPRTCTTGDTAIAKNTTQLKTLSTYTSAFFDTDSIWGIDAVYNSGYPYLKWTNPVLASISFVSPADGSSYTYPDSIDLVWTARGDTSFTLVFGSDSVIVSDTAYTYHVENIRDDLTFKVYLTNRPTFTAFKPVYIFPSKYLEIDTVITKGKDSFGSDRLGIVTKSVGVDIVNYYVDKDSTWKWVGSKALTNNGTIALDTAIVVTGVLVNKLFRVLEAVDTLQASTYRIELIDSAAIMPRVQSCSVHKWHAISYDPATKYTMVSGAYIIDASCGWNASFKLQELGTVTLSIDTTDGYTRIKREGIGLPKIPWLSGTTSPPYLYNLANALLFTIGAYGYTAPGTTKTISYGGATLWTGETGTSTDGIIFARIPNFFGYDTIQVWKSYMMETRPSSRDITMTIAGDRYFWIFKNSAINRTAVLARLPKTLPSYSILHDDYDLVESGGSEIKTNTYRNSFRGIHPKIYKYGQPDGVRR